jgi:predicted GNAT superfamily acetyltransferase
VFGLYRRVRGGGGVTAPIVVSLVDRKETVWAEEVERLRGAFGAPWNPLLFPQHFLASTFPKIGGQLARFEQEGALIAVGSLFPRGVRPDARRIYTLRFHPVRKGESGAWVRPLLPEIGATLGGAKIVFYDPAQPHQFERTNRVLPQGIGIGTPSDEEAQTIRHLQETIWGAEDDALYPADLHSLGFGAGTTLVARQEGQIVGFLFGFYRFRGSPLPPEWDALYGGNLRLESQLLGVLPTVRKRGVGFLLKRAQAEDAREQGIGIVNWTVDPLQFSNAVLNFGRLKALAFDFYPEHYNFRNALNQVAASRFGITWLVQTGRVRAALAADRGGTIVDLATTPAITRVNAGAAMPRLDADAPTIAIEIPANWNAVQRDDLGLALRWRETTDRLFAHYLGCAPGRYAVTGVGQDGDARFLLAERITPEFLARFGS